MFRTGLHLEFQVDTYYGLNPTPQLSSLIGSKCVDVKDEISHATLNMMIKIKRLQLSHIVCINMILQNKVQRSITNNFSIGEGPRISITITVQGKVNNTHMLMIWIRCILHTGGRRI